MRYTLNIYNVFSNIGPKLTKEERLAKTQREKTPAGKVN